MLKAHDGHLDGGLVVGPLSAHCLLSYAGAIRSLLPEELPDRGLHPSLPLTAHAAHELAARGSLPRRREQAVLRGEPAKRFCDAVANPALDHTCRRACRREVLPQKARDLDDDLGRAPRVVRAASVQHEPALRRARARVAQPARVVWRDEVLRDKA